MSSRHTFKDSESRELPESQRELSRLSIRTMSVPALRGMIILSSSPPPDTALGVSAGVLSRETGVSTVGQWLSTDGAVASDRTGFVLKVLSHRIVAIGEKSSVLSPLTLFIMAVSACESLLGAHMTVSYGDNNGGQAIGSMSNVDRL